MKNMSFALNLKKARSDAGISVKQISGFLKSIGFKAGTNTIYSWENGNSQPTPDALLYMCQKYGIQNPLEYFGYKKSPASAEAEAGDVTISVNEEEYDLVMGYRELNEEGQHLIEGAMESALCNPKYKKCPDFEKKEIEA